MAGAVMGDDLAPQGFWPGSVGGLDVDVRVVSGMVFGLAPGRHHPFAAFVRDFDAAGVKSLVFQAAEEVLLAVRRGAQVLWERLPSVACDLPRFVSLLADLAFQEEGPFAGAVKVLGTLPDA